MAFLLAFSLGTGSISDIAIEHFSALSKDITTKAVMNDNVGTLKLANSPDAEIWDETEIEPTTVYVSDANGLKVFKKPSKQSKSVNSLSYGTPVRVVAVASGYKGNKAKFYKVSGNSDLYISAAGTLDHEPKDIELNVKNILQNPELPNGCEVTSLAIVMNYIGETVDKCVLSDNFLPKSSTLFEDPNVYYLREPRSNGFYCYAGPIITCVYNYNDATGANLTATDYTGSEVNTLYNLLDAGHPVIIWGTLRWNEPYKYESGLYGNLHCMVLSGYSETTVTIQDPVYGASQRVNRETFEHVWREMGSRAVVVSK